MLILGILAAIALPAFFNQKDKAGDAKAKENAHTAQVAVETCATDANGSYADCNTADATNTAALKKIEPTLSSDVTITSTADDDGEGYVISSESSNNTDFEITRASSGAVTYNCTAQGEGGCPTGGNWGA